MNVEGIFGFEPIRFTNIEYIGFFGFDRLAIDYFLSKVITQNILYSAYHSPKSITEIADLLGVKSCFIKDEILFLEDNGFMDKVSKDKYLTNILIHDFPKDIREKRHTIFSKYAKIVCDTYIPHIIKDCKSWTNDKIYTPQNDFNFFLWSIITLALKKKTEILDLSEHLEKYYVKRNDGGEYLVFTSIKKDETKDYTESVFHTFGEQNISFVPKEKYPVDVWQFNSNYDLREKNWNKTIQYSLIHLYDYIAGRLTSDSIDIDKFSELYQNKLLIKENSHKNEHVNLIITTLDYEELYDLLPDKPEDFIRLNNELSEELYKISKDYYPSHIKSLSKVYHKKSLNSDDIITRVLEHLLKSNILKPLTDNQKMTVNTIMFCDKLPQ